MTHTPGPWRREGRFVYALGEGETNVFSANVQGGGSGSDVATLAEQEANARLIAAAPELLEEGIKATRLLRLLTIRQIIEGGDETIEASGLNPWAMNEGLATGDERFDPWKMDAAIAKAENGQGHDG